MLSTTYLLSSVRHILIENKDCENVDLTHDMEWMFRGGARLWYFFIV